MFIYYKYVSINIVGGLVFILSLFSVWERKIFIMDVIFCFFIVDNIFGD